MSIAKLTWRSIRSFFGRYMALFLIVALSVGFFTGLKLTKSAMVNTLENYANEQRLYDFRVFSTLGFSEEDIERLSEIDGVSAAEGTVSAAILLEHNGEALPCELMSLPEKVNLPTLVAGRLPETAGEVLADDRKFSEADIGTVFTVADNNTEETTELLDTEEFIVVGLAKSPLYIGNDRGTANIGNGSLQAFFYAPVDSFTGEIFTEASLSLAERAKLYSIDYDRLIEKYEDEVSRRCMELAEIRYEELLAEYGVSAEVAAQMGIARPETYVLTRDENAGCASFENDTSIVSGIANIFPLFFVLIAMLVCITTMTRMVDEERTQNGVLLALGFSHRAVMAKYLLYAGSATVLGWGLGFFLGTWGLPKLFWYAFSSLYDFAPMKYLFSPSWALGTLMVSLAGILGSAWFSCIKELRENPAILLRPKAGKIGKRIFLERLTPVWKRLSFLQKITTRNMFRYKRRLIMMLVGIGCCAGLVVTAFGVRDSMVSIGTLQYEMIQKYDMEIGFEPDRADTLIEEIQNEDGIKSMVACSVHRADAKTMDASTSVSIYCFESSEDALACWDFHNGNSGISYPENRGALISTRAAEKLGLTVGDPFEVEDTERRSISVTVNGIFDNYIDSFVILSREAYESGLGEWKANTLLVTAAGNAIAEQITDYSEVTSITQLSEKEKSVDDALACVNYIIWIVIAFAGALAFIVIFNLTNINLAERSREIATVEVLGFYPKEIESYVLRENLVLSVIAGLLGLPLGTLFHRVVMDMIVIDYLSFDTHIAPASYVLSLVCTVLFAVLVNLFMKRQIGKIQMVESLKAVE